MLVVDLAAAETDAKCTNFDALLHQFVWDQGRNSCYGYNAARHSCQRTYLLPGILSILLSSSFLFFRQLPAELAERNSAISILHSTSLPDTLDAVLTWRPTATLNETAFRLQLRFEAPKDVKFEMLSRRAALSGNTSL